MDHDDHPPLALTGCFFFLPLAGLLSDKELAESAGEGEPRRPLPLELTGSARDFEGPATIMARHKIGPMRRQQRPTGSTAIRTHCDVRMQTTRETLGVEMMLTPVMISLHLALWRSHLRLDDLFFVDWPRRLYTNNDFYLFFR